MTPRALAGVLVATLAAGCWPYIPGTYDDYTTPKATRIVGQAVYDEYLGGYWDDARFDPWFDDHDLDSGAIWWGWTAEAERQLQALELSAPAGVGECSHGQPTIDDVLDLLEDPGATSATLNGPEGDITLPWNPPMGVFSATVGDLPIGQYDLDALATDDAGNIKVRTFLRVPKPADIDGLSLDDDSYDTVSLNELDFAWNTADELAQYVIISVKLMDADLKTLETGTCAAKYANGDISFSTGLWTKAAQARGAVIILSTANEQWVEIGDRGISSRMLAESRQIGFVGIH